jgi:hypothetical protein
MYFDIPQILNTYNINHIYSIIYYTDGDFEDVTLEEEIGGALAVALLVSSLLEVLPPLDAPFEEGDFPEAGLLLGGLIRRSVLLE